MDSETGKATLPLNFIFFRIKPGQPGRFIDREHSQKSFQNSTEHLGNPYLTLQHKSGNSHFARSSSPGYVPNPRLALTATLEPPDPHIAPLKGFQSHQTGIVGYGSPTAPLLEDASKWRAKLFSAQNELNIISLSRGEAGLAVSEVI